MPGFEGRVLLELYNFSPVRTRLGLVKTNEVPQAVHDLAYPFHARNHGPVGVGHDLEHRTHRCVPLGNEPRPPLTVYKWVAMTIRGLSWNLSR